MPNHIHGIVVIDAAPPMSRVIGAPEANADLWEIARYAGRGKA